MRVFRFLWLVSAGAIGALGIAAACVSMPMGSILATAVVGSLIGAVAHYLIAPPDAARIGLPAGLGARIGWPALGSVAFAGLVTLLGFQAGVIVPLLVAAWTGSAWYTSHPGRPVVPRRPMPVAELAEVEAELGRTAQVFAFPGSLTDEQLCRAWRTSYTALQRVQGTAERAQLAEARSGYLNELELRAPSNFALWMANGARAASDPGRYLLVADPSRPRHS
jgi:hypothetical protein